jgi:putative flippase GtrA
VKPKIVSFYIGYTIVVCVGFAIDLVLFLSLVEIVSVPVFYANLLAFLLGTVVNISLLRIAFADSSHRFSLAMDIAVATATGFGVAVFASFCLAVAIESYSVGILFAKLVMNAATLVVNATIRYIISYSRKSESGGDSI